MRGVQRQRHPHRRGAHDGPAPGRQAGAALRRRAQGRDVLLLPQPGHRAELDRLLRPAHV